MYLFISLTVYKTLTSGRINK